MTFQAVNLVLQSAVPNPPVNGLPQFWGYLTEDTMAEVAINYYFNFSGLLPGRTSRFYVGDQIYCVCSDGNFVLQFSTIGNPIGSSVTTAVPSADIAPGSITTAMLGDGIVTTAKLADGSVTTVKVADSAITTAKIADSSVITAKIADAAVTTDKLEHMTNGQIIIGSTGVAPIIGSITAGANITVTPGAGSITIASAGGSGVAAFTPGFSNVANEMILALPGAFGTTWVNSKTVGGDAASLEQLIFFPFYVPNAFTISSVYLHCTTGSAATSFNIGIYPSDSQFRYPALNAAPLAQTNADTSVSGDLFPSLNFTFTANTWYWMGIQTGDNTQAIVAAPLQMLNFGAGINVLSTSFGANLLRGTGGFTPGVMQNTPVSVGSYVTTAFTNFPVIGVL